MALATVTIHPDDDSWDWGEVEFRTLASGREVLVADGKALGYPVFIGTCSICDAVGHGYPGGGYCPLEDRGWA